MNLVGQNISEQNSSKGVRPVASVPPGELASGTRFSVAQQPAAAVWFLDDHERVVGLGLQAEISPVS